MFKKLFARRLVHSAVGGYESETTQFIKALKAERPHLEESQRQGRALLWDKAPIDLEERSRADEAKVAQKAYPYQAG